MNTSLHRSADAGSGFVPALVGILAIVAILQLLISMAKVTDAQSRLAAIAQDTARLEAGALFQAGIISPAAVLASARSELGNLAAATSVISTQSGSMVQVTMRTKVPIVTLANLASVTTTVTGRAAILLEPK